MSSITEKKIEDILVEAGLITLEKLKEVKEVEARTGEKIEKILLSEGVINYKEILGLIAKKMGVEFVDLDSKKVNKNAILRLSPELAKKYSIFPFDIYNNILFVAMEKPDDIFLLDEIKVYTQMEIKPFLADSRLITKAINYFYSEKKENAPASPGTSGAKLVQAPVQKREDAYSSSQTTLNRQENQVDYKVEDFFKGTIEKALKVENITDIHIDTMSNTIRIALTVKY